MRDHPGRFGAFGTIPFTDTERSLKEIEYALDTLRLDGFQLMTSYAGKYLGDPVFPNIRWIFSHSGGTAPFLVSRFQQEERLMKDKSEKLPKGLMYELAKFYYETAQGNHPGALAALVKIVPVSQILYGTDYPFRGGEEVNAGLAAHGFSAAELRAIDRDNALKLMPRLKPSA